MPLAQRRQVQGQPQRIQVVVGVTHLTTYSSACLGRWWRRHLRNGFIMAEIPASRLADAARALMLAGRWAQAAGLLAAAVPAGDAERAVLAVADAGGGG